MAINIIRKKAAKESLVYLYIILTINIVSVYVICVRFPVYYVQQYSRVIVSGHVVISILDVVFLQT